MRFGTTLALDRVSFAVTRGQVLGLVGKNGAGKTTLLRVLLGLLPSETGDVVLDGVRLADDRRAFLQQVGYLPEQLPLYPDMRVGEYLSWRAAMRRVSGKARAQAVDAALTSVNLLDHRTTPIRALSIGMARRVGLADALVASPKLLLLDEPTDGLDPEQRAQALSLIGQLGQERAVVFSTHVLPEVESVAAELCVLHHGRVVGRGATRDLLGRGRRLVVEVAGRQTVLATSLAAIEGVTKVEVIARDGEIERLRVEADRDVREDVAVVAAQNGRLRELVQDGLPALFAELTGASA